MTFIPTSSFPRRRDFILSIAGRPEKQPCLSLPSGAPAAKPVGGNDEEGKSDAKKSATRQVQLGWVIAALTLMASPAQAHIKAGEATGFLSGLAHPVSGLDHIIAMVAVGLWGAQLGAPAIWILPVTFPLVMAFGGFLGLIGIPLPGVEIGIALSGLLLGAVVLLELRVPLYVAAALVGLFGLYHGHAHGAELPPGESGLLYSLGFVLATGCLHAAGIAIGTVHRWNWGRAALRIAGAGISLGGAAFLFDAL